jgi:hypothetical protein
MDPIRGEKSNMSTPSLENLELRALQQRNHLHQTATELKSKITAAREKLDITKNARKHFVGAVVMLGAVGFVSGYAFTGIFTRH